MAFSRQHRKILQLAFFFFVDWVVCNVLRTETSSLALYTLVQEIVLLCMFHLETEPEMIFQTFWSQDLRHVSSSVLQIKSSSTRSQVLLKQGFQKKEKRLPPSTVSEITSVTHTWRHVLHDRSRTLGMHISMLTESELYTLLQKILRVNFLLLSCYFYFILQFENDWMISQDPRYFRININNRMFFFY